MRERNDTEWKEAMRVGITDQEESGRVRGKSNEEVRAVNGRREERRR